MNTINVEIKEFREKWYPAERGEGIYTNGSLRGKIIYEDDVFFVIKLEGK